ncbi:putative acyl-coenzyme A synthetase [Venturia nashicola]|uniref:Putative acyl-coenzyme A synthetase n=1 Tax=Venturia nashicola TaxID=86259 RepID=A0A4Z1P2E9_9PEZI|nr:putative acyl-coenzyme A synthetase [Venturia nashicola]
MRIIRQQKKYEVPNLDLLTFLFDSEYSASQEDALLHVSAYQPSHSITKAQLRLYSEQIAYGLRHQYGIGAEGPYKDVVTVLSSGQPYVPAVLFGVVAAGGVFSAASHSFTPRELARQIEQGKSDLLICSNDVKNIGLSAAEICGLSPDRVVVMGASPSWSLKSADGQVAVTTEERLPFRRVTNKKELKQSLIMLLWTAPKLAAGETFTSMRMLAHLPIAHIAGVIGYLTGPLLVGGTVYWLRKFQWDHFLKYSKEYKVTALYTVPSIYLRIAKSEEVTDHFECVEAASTGAALMDEELQKAANKKLGRGGTTFIGQTWGLSETTGAVTFMPKGEMDDTGSISPVMPGMQIRCVDEDFLDVDPGKPGELVVQGDIVTNGYYNNPKATKESFRDGWFCTGDIAVERNGKFYIVDRKKEIFKYKGLQIAPAELEGLLDTHPLIQEAAVVGLPKQGEGELPRAYVVADPSKISEEEIKAFVASRAAPHKQLRGGVVFVKELPKNAIGKILRRELREQAKMEMRTSKL